MSTISTSSTSKLDLPINNSKQFKSHSTKKNLKLNDQIISSQNNPLLRFFKQTTRKWRWWNLISIFLFFLIFKELFTLTKKLNFLAEDRGILRIEKRQYPFKTYSHLDTNTENSIEKGTQIYHVTKEFGPAVLTDLGKTVTSLVAAQQATGSVQAAVVMPYYPFMKRWVTEKEIDMVMDIRGKKSNQIMTVEFRVWKMMYAFNPPVQKQSVYEWQMINNVNTSVLITPQREPNPEDVVPVYMISHANKKPFNQAFKYRTLDEIHTEKGLPLEWRDQYFAKAAATFLAHKATATDEESIFAPIRIVPRVDVVHIHGASNAFVAKFLQDKKEADDLGPRPPAIVYSMYNQDEEIKYTNTFRNIRKFLDQWSDRENLYEYTYSAKFYMYKFILDRADAVIFTNRSLAIDMVEGRHDFHLRELVMVEILKKAQEGRFYGINDGVDFHTTEHPFITDKLYHRQMGFPEYANDLIKEQPPLYSTDLLRTLALDIPQDEPTYWTLSEDPEDFITLSKQRAKNLLIKRSVLSEEDLNRPMVLLRGPLRDNAGLDMIVSAAPLFVKHNMRLVILGQAVDFPMSELDFLRKTYGRHISIVTDEKKKRQLGIFIRAAADFVIDPHPDAHDDAILIEDMAFGAAVITTGTGKHRDALIDRPFGSRRISVAYLDPSDPISEGSIVTSYEYFNSYLFKFGSLESLDLALSDVSNDFSRLLMSGSLREEFVLRMIRGALNLGWDRNNFHGPVHEYHRVYQLVLEERFIPEIRRHEVEQEHELVSRIQETEDVFDW